MAVTTNDNIKALLKVYYKDGVENFLQLKTVYLIKSLNPCFLFCMNQYSARMTRK